MQQSSVAMAAKELLTCRRNITFLLHPTITGEPHELTAETLQDSQLNFVSRPDFLRFLKEHGDACLHAVHHLSKDCQSAVDLIRSIGLYHRMNERLAKCLLLCDRRLSLRRPAAYHHSNLYHCRSFRAGSSARQHPE
jgi:CRP/FNR family transcriptional regulator